MHCIFLPGMMCDERLFASQIRQLETQARCSVVVARTGDTIEEYASTALASIDAATTDPANADLEHADLEHADKTVLIGLSMGGIVAMECIRQQPQRVDALILMDTNHLAEHPDRQALRYPQIERSLGGELRDILVDEMKPVYLAPDNRDDDALLGLVLDMALGLGADVFARQSRALMHRADYSDTLKNWNKTTLVMCGAYDDLCPLERHEMMHALMSASTLHVLDNAGHLPTLETPAAVNRVLLEFLTSLS